MLLKNGKLGVKRMYTAEILLLGAAIVGIVAAVLGIVAAALVASESAGDAALGLGLASGALSIVAGVLIIVGFIMYLVGIGTAAKDSSLFKTAIVFIFVSIVSAIISTIFSGISTSWSGYVSDAFELLQSIAELLTVLYIVDGIIDFAQQVGDAKVQQKGATFKWLLMIIYGLAAAIILVFIICGATIGSAIAISVLGFVSSILSVVKYFVFLTFLAKAKNMAWEKANGNPEIEA